MLRRAARFAPWLTGAAAAAMLAGCAGMSVQPPRGTDLAGAWKLNFAASDDPQKLLARMRAEAVKRIGRQPPHAHHGDPLRRSPMAHLIEAAVARGDFLAIRQGPGEFVLDYGTSSRRFTPGQHSVVSTEGGVGDQISGWEGRAYVIRVKAQSGPNVSERYQRSADGRQLLETLAIDAAELPAVTLKRVYDPTDERAPALLPDTD